MDDAWTQLAEMIREFRGGMGGTKAARALGWSGRKLRSHESSHTATARLPNFDDLVMMRVVWSLTRDEWRLLLELREAARPIEAAHRKRLAGPWQGQD